MVFDVVAVISSAAAANAHLCTMLVAAIQLQLTAHAIVIGAVAACRSSCRNWYSILIVYVVLLSLGAVCCSSYYTQCLMLLLKLVLKLLLLLVILLLLPI